MRDQRAHQHHPPLHLSMSTDFIKLKLLQKNTFRKFLICLRLFNVYLRGINVITMRISKGYIEVNWAYKSSSVSFLKTSQYTRPSSSVKINSYVLSNMFDQTKKKLIYFALKRLIIKTQKCSFSFKIVCKITQQAQAARVKVILWYNCYCFNEMHAIRQMKYFVRPR